MNGGFKKYRWIRKIGMLYDKVIATKFPITAAINKERVLANICMYQSTVAQRTDGFLDKKEIKQL
jgi:hypothetical protein